MASSITSLGVASGNDFSSIVEELVSLKKTSVTRQTTKRSNANTIELSGVSTLKSALSTFQSTITAFTDNSNVFNGHKVTTTQGTTSVFSVETTDDCANTSFDLGVIQTAKGEKLTQKFNTADGFQNSFSAGTLTISQGTDDDGNAKSFTVEVKEGDTLETIRKRINSNNELGITASLVQTSNGFSLSLSSSTTGDDADPITISVDSEDSEGHDSLSALTRSSDDLGSWTQTQKAQDAVITVDGEEVRSSTNTFSDGQIAGLKITVNQLSEAATENDSNVVTTSDGKSVKTYNVKVADDYDSLSTKMQSFVTGFNTLMTSLTKLSASNTYTDGESNEDGGDLAGDASVRSIKSQLTSMVTRFGTTEEGLSIFDLGITYNKDGTLSFSSTDFTEAMEKHPSAVKSLLTDKDTGLFSKMDSYLDDYTETSGILDQRTDSLNKEKTRIEEQQERDTDTIEKYQEMLTQKYSNLDTLMANYSSSLSSLTSVLSSLSTSSSKSS